MKTILLTSLAALALLPVAHAQDDSHTGVYASVNVGKNLFYSAADELTGSFKGYGWNASLGYTFTQHVSAEIGFMQNSERMSIKSHINVPYLAAKFSVPVTEKVDFITKIGVMEVMHKGDNGRYPYIGVGASYLLNDKMNLTAMYQGGVYGIGGAGLLGVGVDYKI